MVLPPPVADKSFPWSMDMQDLEYAYRCKFVWSLHFERLAFELGVLRP